MPRMAARVGSNLFRRPDRDDLATGIPAFRPHIDDPIGRLDDVEVVLDDEERAAAFDELAEAASSLATSSK